jgi:succinyl-CoA synthetase beta subunit
VAEGVIEAAKKVGLSIPMVVRLEGTNAEKAREMLDHSGLKITSATSMRDAAEKVAAAVQAG